MRLRPLLVALGLACCDGAQAPPPTVLEDLPQGVAAKVGDELISVSAVARVAKVQGISPAEARERLVRDALLSAHGRALLGETGGVTQIERAALARAMIERLEQQVRARGEPTDAEIQRITELRWIEVDRPPAARTTHAVVMVEATTDRRAARELATKIAAAVRGAHDAKEFRARAEKVPRGALKVSVEALPPVTADGRVIAKPQSGPAQRFDPKFAEAANAIAEVGQQSPVVESSFGLHVILLEEKLAGRSLPLEQRRKVLRDEALAARARVAKDQLELELARGAKIEIDHAAPTLTGEIRIQP
jgi:peptidyl-prolyl cis-trans isomerase C